MKPTRRQLPHDVPHWVPDDSTYFITINARERGQNIFCNDRTAAAMLASIHIYERLGKWFVNAMMIMPDHLHLIAIFSRTFGIRGVIAAWKSYHAKTLGIVWQYNFFEHRLRNDSEVQEKTNYVLMNPVRKGLADDWRNWPHKFVRGDW